ncbi:hypothetical protein NC651_011060 [Populus alba x Populus x berolinensis]|nr:hypothetical protein NC651_011060 [Populus alba x Populus x berolinensis]
MRLAMRVWEAMGPRAEGFSRSRPKIKTRGGLVVGRERRRKSIQGCVAPLSAWPGGEEEKSKWGVVL